MNKIKKSMDVGWRQRIVLTLASVIVRKNPGRFIMGVPFNQAFLFRNIVAVARRRSKQLGAFLDLN